jgi:MFS family permease
MTGDARSTWSPLAHPLFRLLWIASTASHIGSYMTDVAQGWLMSSLTPSPLTVSLLLTAESLPFFALGLPAGALADIVDRRSLLVVTQLAMAVAVGTLAAATFTGIVTPSMLLALAFALGIATALNDPAWYAVVPELLPKEELAAGVTLSGVGVNVARTLGPALGGFVVAASGSSSCSSSGGASARHPCFRPSACSAPSGRACASLDTRPRCAACCFGRSCSWCVPRESWR